MFCCHLLTELNHQKDSNICYNCQVNLEKEKKKVKSKRKGKSKK